MAKESKAPFAYLKEAKTSYLKEFTEEERIEYWNMYGDLLSRRMCYKQLSDQELDNDLSTRMFTNREKEVIFLKEEAFKELLFKLLEPKDLDLIFHTNYGYVSHRVDKDGDILYPPTEESPFWWDWGGLGLGSPSSSSSKSSNRTSSNIIE